jgi:hypothetical protein
VWNIDLLKMADMMPTQCVHMNCKESASNELFASNTASHVKHRSRPSQTPTHVDDLWPPCDSETVRSVQKYN